ncbi:MAG: hypothetical protein WBA77_12225 [Microcoleaceae cyanobacterium]
MADNDFTRCSIRVPQSVYEKIETIAIANGAKINSRSKRPQVSPTLIELIRIGLDHYSQERSTIAPAAESELKTESHPQENQQLEQFNQILKSQQHSQQTIEQQLTQIQTSQQLTQADINHLYRLVSQLCLSITSPEEKHLNSSIISQASFNHLSQSTHDLPLAASLDQWTVNHQWLCANDCFSNDSFENWQNGEIRQDLQGRYWRRVELTHVLGGFEMPSDLASSQIFYVLDHNR